MPAHKAGRPAGQRQCIARVELRTASNIYCPAATRSTRRCCRHKSRIIAPHKNIRRRRRTAAQHDSGSWPSLSIRARPGCSGCCRCAFFYHADNDLNSPTDVNNAPSPRQSQLQRVPQSQNSAIVHRRYDQVHRARKKPSPQYSIHTFNDFKYIFVIFGKNHHNSSFY